LDIGGGSTEVVIGKPRSLLSTNSMLTARSTDIGSVRLTERFLKTDPMPPNEVDRLRQHAEPSCVRPGRLKISRA
jgi:exopolyphosphatase/guanosine-5'-triphosphate,3'-diphosphate pyrophosphatase